MSVSQSVLHSEGFSPAQDNDPCTSRGPGAQGPTVLCQELRLYVNGVRRGFFSHNAQWYKAAALQQQ